MFWLGLPAIHVYEIGFFLPTVLPCSRCYSHESMFSNLEVAATGSPGKLFNSKAQESQYHYFLSGLNSSMLVLIFLLLVITIFCWCFTTIILNSFSTFTFEIYGEWHVHWLMKYVQVQYVCLSILIKLWWPKNWSKVLMYTISGNFSTDQIVMEL